MDKRQEIQKELEEIAPFLASLEKKEDFNIPTNYFNTLEQEIFSQLSTNTTPQVVKTPSRVSILDRLHQEIQLFFQAKYAFALASVCIILISCIVFFTKSGNTGGDTYPIVTLSDEEINTYVEANLDEFEVTDLYEVLDEDLVYDELFPDLNQNTVEEYFEEHIDELDDDLLEELL